MIRFFTTPLIINFWASPNNSIYTLGNWGASRAERNALAALKVLEPDFPRDPIVRPEPETVPPVPTDVPMPHQHDVPAPSPHDVPAPDPGTVPPQPKPRPVP
jgi:hypothetical protein